MKKLNIETASIVAQDSENRNTFADAMRNFERAYAAGDYGVELMELANAIAYSVLGKVLDPQRKTAPERENVSNSGFNPALVSVRRGLTGDLHALANIAYNDGIAAHLAYNDNGDLVEIVDDADAMNAIASLAGERLSDGIDLRQTAALALMEAARDYGAVEGWLESSITVHRLKRKVLIKETDTAAYEDVESTPISEVYREVRRAIMASRAMATDPRNGYSYIEEMTEDGLDTVYIRMGKYADIGGYNCNGLYTVGRAELDQYNAILDALNLTDRQRQIIGLRMRGYGKKAIGTYIGIDPNNVGRTLTQVQKKCEKIGFTPEMWREMTRRRIDTEAGRDEN